MADISIGSDGLLTTTLNDNDRVTITRAETGQQVATMKVSDFRASLCGMDYSALTEQAVPGEFFVDRSGNRKQVYGRRMKLSATLIQADTQVCVYFYTIIANVSGVIDVSGILSIPYTGGGANEGDVLIYTMSGAYIQNEHYRCQLYVYSQTNTVNLVVEAYHPGALGKTVTADFFVKYIKM